jgi:hypothetical protein
MLSTAEKQLLESVAGVFDVSIGEFIRAAALAKARRILRSNKRRSDTDTKLSR